MKVYESLCNIFKETHNINHVINLLEWDSQLLMPRGGIADRISQINTLTSIKMDILTNSCVENLIQEASKQRHHLDDLHRVNLSHMEKEYNNAKIIPVDLFHAFNQACISSREAWKIAKQENNFKLWLPKLEEVVNITTKMAEVKSEFLKCSKYEALLDNYEPRLHINTINSTFTEVGKFLRDFIKVISDQQPKTKTASNAIFSLDKQRNLSKELIQLMQLPDESLRIDESAHPFTIGNQFDTRITTTYNEKDFIQGFSGTLHECGHALYNLNLPKDLYGLPVGQHMGMAMHEAQALLFEKQIGRSQEFIGYMLPTFKKVLHGKSWSAKNIYKTMNRVAASPIRIYADEVTYPAHIMIRYTIEKSMIEGELKVRDLPGVWEEEMKHYLGITPQSDAEGCMQDIHWASGIFGYFPSYLLGLIISAQLFAKIQHDIPDVMKQIARGNLKEIINWLVNNIYKHGNKYNLQEVMKRVVGEQINAKHYISYLQSKYDSNSK